ncbi:MAG: hypothetical protein H7X92_11145 [Chitinophagales bacterium]|nr:hypothetical protein [Hyphomicrobiales bacterium]
MTHVLQHARARLNSRLFALTAAIGVAAAISASAPAQAAQCKPFHVNTMSVILNNKDAAKHNAKWAWANKTGGMYGMSWRHWSNAKGKDVDCFKAGFGFRCAASAKPCI